MASDLLVFENIARFMAVLGGMIAVIFVVYAGIQWMTAAGDPQKIAQARSSLIGTVVGLVVVGAAFVIPVAVSQFVIEPVGGIRVAQNSGLDCDGILKKQLVVNRTVSSANAVNLLVSAIRSRYEACDDNLWTPWADLRRPPFGVNNCFDTPDYDSIEGVGVPRGLRRGVSVHRATFRDANNNILIYWDRFSLTGDAGSTEGLPGDGSICWMYVHGLGVWVQSYSRY